MKQYCKNFNKDFKNDQHKQRSEKRKKGWSVLNNAKGHPGKGILLAKAQRHAVSLVWKVYIVNNTQICNTAQGKWGLWWCLTCLGSWNNKDSGDWSKRLARWPRSFFSNWGLWFYTVECNSWFSPGTTSPKLLGMVEYPLLESFGILKSS